MPPLEALCSLRWNAERQVVEIIDQTLLPHGLHWCELQSLESYCHAISTHAGARRALIGITAAFGLAQRWRSTHNGTPPARQRCPAGDTPDGGQPALGVEAVTAAVHDLEPPNRAAAALAAAQLLRTRTSRIAHVSASMACCCRAIKPAGPLNIMTHCNAGWLATVQWGTALAPIYKAHAAGIPCTSGFRNPAAQPGHAPDGLGAAAGGVPCTLVADNSCGQLLRRGAVDCVLVGGDRTAANGDVCNKIGTYLKALAACANGVPFCAALPESTIDWRCASGDDIPIEERTESEVLAVTGVDARGQRRELVLAGSGARAHNPAFDITPAALVTALVTEYGSFEASAEGLARLRSQMSSSSPM